MKTIALLLATVALATSLPQIRTAVQGFDGTVKSSRIVGGREAIPHTLPYQAHLTLTGTATIWSCSGSIISSYYILTSARCVEGGIEAVVTLGSHNTSSPEPDQISYTTTNILIHPNYTKPPGTYLNDIALVKTDFEIPFTYHIQPIGLPTAQDLLDGETFSGRIARASGWGLTDGIDDETTSTILRYYDGKVLKNSDCMKSLIYARDNLVICSSSSAVICRGDVGAPLVTDFKLVGIGSFWVINCLPDYPSAFTRVSGHMQWITENSDVEIS